MRKARESLMFPGWIEQKPVLQYLVLFSEQEGATYETRVWPRSVSAIEEQSEALVPSKLVLHAKGW